MNTEEIYTGSIIKESLENEEILNDFKIINITVTDDEKPEDRWHIYTVEGTQDILQKLSKVIKPEKFYSHFWNKNKDIIAVFRDKIFNFNYNDKTSWQPAIEYGESIGIPKEQLDFLID
jgi:hypothetical protein